MTAIAKIAAPTLLILILAAGTAFPDTYLIQPDGSGDFSDLTTAMGNAVDGDTIMLADGLYTGRGNRDINYDGKEVVVCSQSGNPANCVIDIEGEFNDTAERGFIFNNDETEASVLRDIKIIHGNADAPCPECEGGAVYVHDASPTMENLILEDNYALNGAGIMVNGGSPTIKNCVFINNDTFDGGGFMCLSGDHPILEGCVFYNNTATMRGAAISGQGECVIEVVNCTIAHNGSTVGSAISSWENDYIIENSIIAYNGDSLAVWATGDPEITISYTDIYGNTGGDWVGPIAGQGTLNGNKNEAPIFVDYENRDYHLTVNSPCIDGGNPDSPYDPDNTVADMGAYYYYQIVSIDNTELLPNRTGLLANYPNPFNANTVIAFELASRGDVQLDIYDIAGRKVTTAAQGMFEAGKYQVDWYADVVSGVYFSVLRTDSGVYTNKMVLLK